MARSRQEGVLFLPFHLQHCVNNRNFAAQMVISEDLVTPFGEVRDEGREGIRCKAGAVPATVFAFLVQRMHVTGTSSWEDALPGKSQETCHFA